MCDPLPITEKTIGPVVNLLEGFQDDRSLAEREQTWYIRKGGLAHRCGRFQDLSILQMNHDHHRVDRGGALVIRDIQSGDGVDGSPIIFDVQAPSEHLLNSGCLGGWDIPTVEASNIHRFSRKGSRGREDCSSRSNSAMSWPVSGANRIPLR